MSSLFRLFDITRDIRADFTLETYEFAEVPEENWLYPAFRAFERLRDEAFCPSTFVTIGTGPGLDAVGAAHLLKPQTIVVTDIHPEVTPIALRNIARNIDPQTSVTGLVGDLCEPLRAHGIKADLVYANLPLLPSADVSSDMRSATFVSHEKFRDAPEIYRRYRLAMIHVFLRDVRSSLTDNGRVIVSVGARMPAELINRLFEESGYAMRDLFIMLKVQSQPDDVLPAFAAAEREEGVRFDFYRMKNAIAAIGAEPSDRIDATTALDLHRRGETIGHVVRMIEGVPFSAA